MAGWNRPRVTIVSLINDFVHRVKYAEDRGLSPDVAQEYLNGLDVEYSTSLSYENILNKYWLPAFGNWWMPDIKPKHIKTKPA